MGGHDLADQFPRQKVLDTVHDEALAADHPAPAHVENLHRCLEVVARQAEHVDILVAGPDHLLALGHLADASEPVTPAGRRLVLETGRGRLHLGDQAGLDLVRVSAEDPAQVGDDSVVVLPPDLSDTGPCALLDVVEQARPSETTVCLQLVV